MENTTNSSIIGRKTFLIGVDPNSFPESYLESLLAQGFETYQITADNVCPMEQKVEMIVALYPSSILLFYIDSPIEHTTWPQFVQQLMLRHGKEIQVGILYSKRGIDAERQELEKLYAQIGVHCGCTALSYQKAQNLQIVSNLLVANNANGRRKIVRAICNATSEVSFTVGVMRIRGPLQDISLSHFSCILEEQPEYVSLHQHFTDVQLLVNGSRYHSNAELVMQRPTPSGLLHIFMFNKADRSPGLAEEDFYKLCPKIYHMVTDGTKEKLRDSFFMLNRFKSEKITTENLVAKVQIQMKLLEEKKAKKPKVNAPLTL